MFIRFLARAIGPQALKITAGFAASGAVAAIAGKMDRERQRLYQSHRFADLSKISNSTTVTGIYENKYQNFNPHLKKVLEDGYQLNGEHVKGLVVAMSAHNIAVPQTYSNSIQSTETACDWLYKFALRAQKLGLADDINARALKALASAVFEKHDEVKKRYKIDKPKMPGAVFGQR